MNVPRCVPSTPRVPSKRSNAIAPRSDRPAGEPDALEGATVATAGGSFEGATVAGAIELAAGPQAHSSIAMTTDADADACMVGRFQRDISHPFRQPRRPCRRPKRQVCAMAGGRGLAGRSAHQPILHGGCAGPIPSTGAAQGMCCLRGKRRRSIPATNRVARNCDMMRPSHFGCQRNGARHVDPLATLGDSQLGCMSRNVR